MTEQDAIKASIKHWEEKRCMELAIDIYMGACSLCDWVREKAGQLPIGAAGAEKTKCKRNCQLKEMGDTFCCCETYRACNEIVNGADNYTQKDWERVCDAMIEKLESLLNV